MTGSPWAHVCRRLGLFAAPKATVVVGASLLAAALITSHILGRRRRLIHISARAAAGLLPPIHLLATPDQPLPQRRSPQTAVVSKASMAGGHGSTLSLRAAGVTPRSTVRALTSRLRLLEMNPRCPSLQAVE